MKNIIFLLIFTLGITACDDYLDINQDPNSPTEENITSDMVLPGVEMNLASSYGNFLRIVGGYYAQHYAHNFGTSNYLDYSEFKMSATRSSGTYTQLTARVLNNIKTILKLSEENEEWGTYLAATTLRVFTYQVLVDCYGEVPYTEALDITNLSPNYDEGIDVYKAILAELDNALSLVSPTDAVATNFLFGTTTAKEWISFAKALKLKLLMRMSSTSDVSSELAALIAEDDFPTSDVSYDDCWTDETGKASPFYQEEYANYFGSTQINVIGNIALMQTMIDSNDGRLSQFFEKSDKGEYKGGVSGTNFGTSTQYKSDYFCRPVFTYDMPVYLISVSEIEFFLAEYHARFGTEANAKMHYENAIKASFESAGVSGMAENIYSDTYPYDQANYKELIGIQKWIALGGTNNFEAWCEMRRLNYPAFGTVTGDAIYDEGSDVFQQDLYVPGSLYTPIKMNTSLGDNEILQRFPYAESSSSRNSNTPEYKGDDSPVFWAE
ncbi:SusD/RagB family nutrient-binding outer membrane lipoprotein [Saccharicrinis fermentans]|uniref:Susd and RagB outer membrane lipoprotein n=1 Tax=Saccharicrinis fermentans DSM 9555 = JCM 21142 TaxID=869213 RepID=W7YKN9_9BACT|nr:SusD/RagB family nutrient-binding outer membrane lipoprotein [Saccharicrinis fermentans]GAF05066.1 Susd and RagB outer membrane lipoprotein [Saccharicrinis fermentans DSM 9555 = JCM 21142]